MTRHLRGFTLVELMIGIAIMAVVMASSVSLGTGWINEARVTDARSQMRLAYSKAAAYAIRNGNAVKTGTAAWVCVASGVVYVYEAKPAGPAACGETGSVWHADLAGGSATTVTNSTTATDLFSCIGLNNRGLLVTASIGVTTCTTSQTIYVNRGSTNVATKFIEAGHL